VRSSLPRQPLPRHNQLTDQIGRASSRRLGGEVDHESRFLSGQIKRNEDLAPDDWRRSNPRFQGENFTRNLELVARIADLARTEKCTPSQLALAWVLARSEGHRTDSRNEAGT
jgi:Aldo/keto reductase family